MSKILSQKKLKISKVYQLIPFYMLLQNLNFTLFILFWRAQKYYKHPLISIHRP